MTVQYEIDASDVVEQAARFKKGPEIVTRNSTRAMQSSVLAVSGAVRPLTPVGVSGALRRSISERVSSTKEEVTGTIFSKLTSEVYPVVMNDGRRPGASMPPPAALERWVRLKLGVPAGKVKSVAFVVARSIGRKGIKAKQFMERGFKQAQPRVDGFWAAALDMIIKELADGD